MWRVLTAIAFLTASLSLSCSERERSNPLDPSNPNTGGVGREFWAIAGNNIVTLRWGFNDINDISGFQIYKGEQDGDLSPMLGELLPPGTGRFRDWRVKNDRLYRYQLGIFVSGLGEVTRSVIAEAEPGPEVCWAVSFDTEELIKINPDCRYVLLRVHVPGILRASVSPVDGSVWAVGRSGRSVLRIKPDGSLAGEFGDFGLVRDIAPDPLEGGCWVLDYLRNEIVKLSISGIRREVVVGSGGVPLSRPVSLSLDGESIWISDSGNGRIIRHRFGSADGREDRIRNLPSPGVLVADGPRKVCWAFIQDAKQIVKLDSEMNILLAFELTNVSSMDIGEEGSLWVSRKTYSTDENSLLRISPDGSVDVKAEGFLTPSISVNGRDGTVWVADSSLGVIKKLSPDGRVLRGINGLGRVLGVSVDPSGGLR